MERRKFMKILGIFGLGVITLNGCGTAKTSSQMKGKSTFDAPIHYAPHVPVSFTKTTPTVSGVDFSKSKDKTAVATYKTDGYGDFTMKKNISTDLTAMSEDIPKVYYNKSLLNF